MASLTDSTTYTAQQNRAIRRDVSPSFRTLERAIRQARLEYTFDATPANNDTVKLCFLNARKADVLPELCRISSLNGDLEGVFVLSKVDGDGNETPLTGNGTLDASNHSVSFERASGNDTVQVNEGEFIQLTITTATAIVADDIVQIDIAFADEQLF